MEGKKGKCIQIPNAGEWTAIDCDEKSATIFNIFIGNPFKPYKIMPCVLQGKDFTFCIIPSS